MVYALRAVAVLVLSSRAISHQDFLGAGIRSGSVKRTLGDGLAVGFHGLSALVQTKLEKSPLSGQVFIFRGRRGDLVKLI